MPLFSWRSKFSDLLYKADPDLPVRTIKAQGGQYTGPFHWENRAFSIDELKRLQTFPDDYILTGGQQVAIQQLGNSVPPQFGRILAISILNQLFEVNFPFDIDYLSPHDQLGFRSRKAILTANYQQKAKEAIARQFPREEKIPICGEEKTDGASAAIQHIIAYLGSNFTWAVKGDSAANYPWNIEFSITQQDQLIELYVRTFDDHSVDPALVIEVHPTESWIIPAKAFTY